MPDFDVQNILTMCALALTLASMILVNRNARRATSVQSENRDLARIRDLRAELQDTRKELDECRTLAGEVTRKLTISNREAAQAWTELAELKRLAHRPGMTIDRLREYIGPLAEDSADNAAS